MKPTFDQLWNWNREDNYAWDYFKLLKSEYGGITCDTSTAACRRYEELVKAIELKYATARQELAIQDVFEVETALLQVLPPQNVHIKIWSVRSDYRVLVGEALYRQYMRTSMSNARTDPIETVRADLTDLVEGKHAWYVNAMVMERGIRTLKKMLVYYLVFGFVAAILLTGVLSYIAEADNNFEPVYRGVNMLILAVYAGMLGAVISVARRLKSSVDVPMTDSDPFIRLIGMQNGRTGLHLSVISGAVFALVLYFLFLGGIASDLLSPKLIPLFPFVADNSIASIFYGLLPMDTASLAKLLVWCFVAGFGEKFVPDILQLFSAPTSADQRRSAERLQESADLPPRREGGSASS